MGNATFALHELGWSDFQSLCDMICREILGQTEGDPLVSPRHADSNQGPTSRVCAPPLADSQQRRPV